MEFWNLALSRDTYIYYDLIKADMITYTYFLSRGTFFTIFLTEAWASQYPCEGWGREGAVISRHHYRMTTQQGNNPSFRAFQPFHVFLLTSQILLLSPLSDKTHIKLPSSRTKEQIQSAFSRTLSISSFSIHDDFHRRISANFKLLGKSQKTTLWCPSSGLEAASSWRPG